ncbi:MAG: hypothetical protein WCL34_12910 [Methylococcaceae bacterium]|jgi:hypothetical protein
MYAVEFETQGRGRYIELPFALPTKKTINVRVILMSEQKIEDTAVSKRSSLKKLTTFSKGKKIMEFCREDAYRDGI